MAVCNIFKELTKPTGTFLTFSQYMEDLTAWQTESKYHKVVPNRFVAMNLENISFDNETFPIYLCEQFENACACFKNSQNINWQPDYSTTLFWNTLFNAGLLTYLEEKNENGETIIEGDSPKLSNKIKEIKYVGDIDIQSYNEVDNMGYSEIYCHIPNEAAAYTYSCLTQNFNAVYIQEATAGENLQKLDIKLTSDRTYNLDKKYNFSWNDETINDVATDEESYNINVIVVLYDIWNDGTILAKDVPMGIYLTGKIEEGVIQNSITKFVSNADIYDAGTSYGLRICSRFVVSSEPDSYSAENITVENNNYSELTKVLSQLSISQSKMDEIVNARRVEDQKYKELLSLFTNSKTNVPYIKTVDGKDYWFVNGKMLNESESNTGGSNTICTPYENEELDPYLGYDELILQTSIQTYDNPEGSKFIKAKYGSKKVLLDITEKSEVYDYIKVHWLATHQQQILSIDTDANIDDKVSIVLLKNNNVVIKNEDKEGSNITYSQGSYETKVTDKTQPYTFVVKIGYNAKTATSTPLTVRYVYPTYFGHSVFDPYTPDGFTNMLGNLKKYIIDTKVQSYIVPKSEGSDAAMDEQGNSLRHLYLMYPKEYGELTSITDDDGNEYMADFTKHEFKLHDVDYLLYMDEKGPVSVTNKIIYFK